MLSSLECLSGLSLCRRCQNFPLLYHFMDISLSQFIHLNCGHFHKSAAGAILEFCPVFKGDRRVEHLPLNTIPVHNCSRLAVTQEHQDINRFYLVFDESIIIKN